MAAGIFNTTRVAGEGIALAIVSALLAALTFTALRAVPGIDAQQAALAAPFLAIGELQHAGQLLPQLDMTALAQAYGTAFRHLLYVLAAITVASSLLLLAFLRHPASAHDTASSLPVCDTVS